MTFSPALLLFLLQERSRLEQYLVATDTNPVAWLTALGVSFFLGAAHALTPGHGKTIVAAYLVGSRGRVADAIYLGAVVTFTHTASVFALGLFMLYAARQLDPNVISLWLGIVSGALVTVIGLYLLWQRTIGPEGSGGGNGGGGGFGGHAHSHGHSHGHSHAHSHSHGGVSTGSLLSLGISGGLVPCPEALIVLIFAVSIGRIAFGLALLTAFSLGLAVVLIAIGIAMVLAGPAVAKASGNSPLVARLPVISAAVVTIMGVAIMADAVRKL